MDILDRAKLVVAQRAIALERKEKRSLVIRTEIAEKRLAIATLFRGPEGMVVLYAVALVLAFGLEFFTLWKGSNPCAKSAPSSVESDS